MTIANACISKDIYLVIHSHESCNKYVLLTGVIVITNKHKNLLFSQLSWCTLSSEMSVQKTNSKGSRRSNQNSWCALSSGPNGTLIIKFCITFITDVLRPVRWLRIIWKIDPKSLDLVQRWVVYSFMIIFHMKRW